MQIILSSSSSSSNSSSSSSSSSSSCWLPENVTDIVLYEFPEKFLCLLSDTKVLRIFRRVDGVDSTHLKAHAWALFKLRPASSFQCDIPARPPTTLPDNKKQGPGCKET